MINSVTVSGNITRDIEVRYTSSGNAIGKFGLAQNERFKASNGEWQERPNYFDIVLFGSRAESLKQYLVKGTKVCIQGRLKYSQWQDNNGQNRSRVEIAADGIEFMSRNQNGGQNGYQQPQQQRQQQGYQQPQYVEATDYDGYESSEIPF